MLDTDKMIQDDLDVIKDKVEEDFSALNALQEMLHLLLMRQDHGEEPGQVTKLVNRVDAVAILLNNEISRLIALLRRSGEENTTTRECTRTATLNERISAIENIMSGEISEMKHKISTAAEHSKSNSLRLDSDLVTLRGMLQQEKESLVALEANQKTLNTREVMIEKVVNTEIAKLRRDVQDLTERTGNNYETLTNMIDRKQIDCIDKMDEGYKKLCEKVENDCNGVYKELSEKVLNDINMIKLETVEDYNVLNEKVEQECYGIKEKMDQNFRIFQGNIQEIKEQLNTGDELMKGKFLKMEQSLDSDLGSLREMLHTEKESLIALEHNQKTINTREAMIEKVVNTEIAKLMRNIEEVNEQVGNNHESLTKLVDTSHTTCMDKMEKGYAELSEKVENDCNRVCKEMTEKVNNDFNMIKEETKEDKRTLNEKIENDYNAIREQTNQDFEQLKITLEKDCNVIKEHTSQEYSASVEKIVSQEKQFDIIVENMEHKHKELSKHLEVQLSAIKEQSDYSALNTKLESQEKEYTLVYKLEKNCNLLSEKLDNQCRLMNERIERDNQVLRERLDQENETLTNKLEKESADTKVFSKGLIDDFASIINTTATYSEEDMQVIRNSHEELLKVRIQMAEMNEKISLAQEFTTHNVGSIGEQIGHMNGDINKLLEYQQSLQEQTIIERVKDTEELLQDGLKKIKEELEKVEEELLALKQWQAHVGDREEIAKLPGKMKAIEETARIQVKEQIATVMCEIKKETEKMMGQNINGVEEKDLKALKNEVKRLEDSVKSNFETYRVLLTKCDEQMHSVKEWQKSVKADNERSELQNRILSAEKTMSDNFTKLLEKINARPEPKDTHAERAEALTLVDRIHNVEMLIRDEIRKVKVDIDKFNDDMYAVKKLLEQTDQSKDIVSLHERITTAEDTTIQNLNMLQKQMIEDGDIITTLKTKQEKMEEICYGVAQMNQQLEEMDVMMSTNNKLLKECHQGLGDRGEDIKVLQENVQNNQQLLFMGKGRDEILKLQWILTSYRQLYESGKRIYSPVFCAEVCGYRFQMAIDWSSEKQGRLGIYLKLRHGNGPSRKSLPAFKVPYALGLANHRGGDPLVYFISPGYRMDGIGTDIPGTEKRLCKRSELLPMSVLENFVMNDSITVYCTFKSPKVSDGPAATQLGEGNSLTTLLTKGHSPLPLF